VEFEYCQKGEQGNVLESLRAAFEDGFLPYA
jgi:hypothetical protein